PRAAQGRRPGFSDRLMLSYSAAPRGAGAGVFPVPEAMGMPLVVYTCLRWGALLRPTPDDPPGFVVPRAPTWYRFALQHPSVAVALMAPDDRAELEEDLTGLHQPYPLGAGEYRCLEAHGPRGRRPAGGCSGRCCRLAGSSAWKSHTWRSSPAAPHVRLSAEKATPRTIPQPPDSTARSCPPNGSHRRTVRSSPPVTSERPSGE